MSTPTVMWEALLITCALSRTLTTSASRQIHRVERFQGPMLPNQDSSLTWSVTLLIVSWLRSMPMLEARWCWISRTVIPPA